MQIFKITEAELDRLEKLSKDSLKKLRDHNETVQSYKRDAKSRMLWKQHSAAAAAYMCACSIWIRQGQK